MGTCTQCVTGCCTASKRSINTDSSHHSMEDHPKDLSKSKDSKSSANKYESVSKHISHSTSPTQSDKSSSCSRSDCTVIQDLKRLHSTFTLIDINDEDSIQTELDFEHYLSEHSKSDNRSINKCKDTECEYDTSPPHFMSNHQRIHAYFYHSRKYQKLKTQRSFKFMQNIDDPDNVIDDKIVTTLHSHIEDLDEKDSILTTDDEDEEEEKNTVLSQDTSQNEGTYNLSSQISRLLLPALNKAFTRDEGELKRENSSSPPPPINPNLQVQFNASISRAPSISHIYLGQRQELCEDSTNCPKVQQLLKFCENINPEMSTNKEYDTEKMKNYWDHYCESHLEEYEKLVCIHGGDAINIDEKDEDKDDDEDEDTDCKYLLMAKTNDNIENNLQILLHRHFYHRNIMKEENSRIKYVKETMHGQKIIDKFKPTMNAILSGSGNKINQNKVLEFGYPFECEREEAKFNNPKEEILKNNICSIEIKHWNQLFNRCSASNGYAKALKTRQMKLKLKEVIVLKLYTDFDELQRAYRKVYRETDSFKRKEMMRQFYHWNKLLKQSVDKSRDIITQTLYHGINVQLNVSTFSGRYYGPVSTTKIYDVAKGFAGAKGRILEIYPSYGKKGLDVAWLSNFPDEQEVLYFDATFSIKNIHKIEENGFLEPTFDTQLLSVNTIRDLQNNTKFIEKSILKALQTINTESTVLSFNEINDNLDFDDNHTNINSAYSLLTMDSGIDDPQETTAFIKPPSQSPILEDAELRHDLDDQDQENENLESSIDDEGDEKKQNILKSMDDGEAKDIETFNGLKGSELIAIMYLLYLQYKPTEWEKMVKSDKDIYTQIALAKYRDQFGHLTQNVTTIYLEKSSDLIKYFFSMNMENDVNDSITNKAQIRNIIQRQGKFENMKYNINFETIIKLFPKCKQISIDGDNFDWSLKDFIAFLRRFNLDFSGIYLQDIFLRFKQNHYVSHSNQETAKKRLKKTQRKQLTELAKLGWRFINSSHIHRFGFEPEPEKPFLLLFMTEGRVFHHSYSKRLIGTTPKMGLEQESFLPSGQSENYFLDGSNKQLSFYGRINTMQSLHSMGSSVTTKSFVGPGSPEGDHAIIDFNPKHLFLSQQILDKCHYKQELVVLLENRKQAVYRENVSSNISTSTVNLMSPHQLTSHHTSMSFVDEELFDDLCRKVETLILYPIHEDLYTIFYETFAEKKKSILELMTIKLIFPNVTDIYLRKTTFNSRICDNLISFIIECDNKLKYKSKSKIKRIFYSIDKQCASRDVAKLKLRLNVYRWDFSTIEQVAYKQELQDIV